MDFSFIRTFEFGNKKSTSRKMRGNRSVTIISDRIIFLVNLKSIVTIFFWNMRLFFTLDFGFFVSNIP